MRRILTVYIDTDGDLTEPTWPQLAYLITTGQYHEAAILDSLVPSLTDLQDARQIIEGVKTVDTRPTAARPKFGQHVADALTDIARDRSHQ